MSKLMIVLGIVLLAVGIALALVGLVNPAQIQIYGISLDTAAQMLVGGILAIGLGGMIGALGRGTVNSPAEVTVETPVVEAPAVSAPVVKAPEAPAPETAPAPSPAAAPAEQPARIRFPGFGRKAEATATAGAAVATTAAAEPVTPSVQETIVALEKAKSDITKSMTGMESVVTPPAIEPAGPEDDADDLPAEDLPEGELYVMEEKIIRGRPARILSDETVEAETDEGWMRFENLEHLNEYLDAAEGV
jgi:hypothetical protein